MKIVETSKGVKPLGPYSQAVSSNGFIFVSGTVGIDPGTGKVVAGGIREQTKQALENIKVVLEEGGSSLDSVTKAGVFIKEASFFKDMNEVYATYFSKHKPARTTVVTGFAREDILVEIDIVATTSM